SWRAACGESTEGASPADAGTREERAQARREKWRSQPPFDTEEWLAQRLASDGITEAEFLRLLGESAGALQARCAEGPPRLRELARAFAPWKEAAPLPPLPDAQEAPEFLALAAPLLHAARCRVRERAAELARAFRGAPFDPETVDHLLFADLPGRLHLMLDRTLVLELQVARL